MSIFKQGYIVDACDLPENVEDYCIEHEIGTHYEGYCGYIEDDSVLSKWLKKNGAKFSEDGTLLLAIIPT